MPNVARKSPVAVHEMPAREIYVYYVPRAIDDETGQELAHSAIPGVESIGIIVLTPNEEKAAARRAGDQQHALAFEIAKAALAEYNGSKVASHDGSADKAFTDMGPQGRRLLMEAYVDLTGVDDTVVAGFLTSRKIKA